MASFCQPDTKVTEEEGRAVEKLPPSHWLVGISEGTFSWLMIDEREPAHCAFCHSWVSDPGDVRKLTEEAVRAKQLSNLPEVPVSAPA